LYGKKIFKNALKNKILYRAGGIYLPHVGSWITSLCRAKLHADLHKYEAIDCATDSSKTVHTVPKGNEIGDLKLVCEGFLLLIGPKLYVMFSKEIQKSIQEGDLRERPKKISIETLQNPKEIVRYALHAFWGNVHDLLELHRDRKTSYEIIHMTKTREAIKQRKRARV